MFPEYRHCQLCPRRCGVDRTAGRTGVCGMTADCRVSYIGAHHGEEPAFSGSHGSGTVFFCGCPSHCLFCQNIQISAAGTTEGFVVTPEELLAELRRLAASGVHNLNFVSPDHFWPHIRQACRQLRAEGATLPFLYNCSGYQLPGLIPEVAELMEIFLPDFKFADSALAKLCMGDAAYPEIALAALRRMVSARGFLTPFDPTGRQPARGGVLVRHLVLPGQVENSLQTLELLHREFGPGLPLSVMSQYRPMPACAGQGALARGLSHGEYEAVRERVADLGFEHVYTQELDEGSGFLPDFRAEQPFPGNRR
jgi:putative pyruvate formate lyase activating enzyme